MSLLRGSFMNQDLKTGSVSVEGSATERWVVGFISFCMVIGSYPAYNSISHAFDRKEPGNEVNWFYWRFLFCEFIITVGVLGGLGLIWALFRPVHIQRFLVKLGEKQGLIIGIAIVSNFLVGVFSPVILKRPEWMGWIIALSFIVATLACMALIKVVNRLGI